MVYLPIELGQGRPEVRPHLRHDVFAPVEHLRVEHAAAILGGRTPSGRAGCRRRFCRRGMSGLVTGGGSVAEVTLWAMRFRLYPTAAQKVLLLEQCGHARYVWNLGLEQRLMWARWKGPTPGFNAQAVQLTEARAAAPWLACGSQTVQQQGLRDLDQSWRAFFAGIHRRPTWRK